MKCLVKIEISEMDHPTITVGRVDGNNSKSKNPTSDLMTSRYVTMTSSPIIMIKSADVSTF